MPWGQGHATEALTAIVTLAKPLGLRRLEAICHPDNVASLRVLEKCGFANEGRLPRHSVFPNLDRNRPLDVLRFARSFSPSSG
jgi:RimJ/RimL family protein N-acetyltransferase